MLLYAPVPVCSVPQATVQEVSSLHTLLGFSANEGDALRPELALSYVGSEDITIFVREQSLRHRVKSGNDFPSSLCEWRTVSVDVPELQHRDVR
ncbi:MAG: hypothetical protein TH68_03715 [Candidatus Synechococcus spongiarum 142]|uniref:Uncharacterized protein n=1 Tax=Candidatus Synechococcus spongiarum 142 TaxID=1608213 RepID=A0A6N3X961_9SYNE|nr:MAG: hypothetical protein TH68_03715 [Candidatus Synechococcus spongiarum 142]